MPGATTGDPTHDKVMWKRTVKQGFRTQGAPQSFLSIYPQTRICLFYYFMTFTDSSDINRVVAVNGGYSLLQCVGFSLWSMGSRAQ